MQGAELEPYEGIGFESLVELLSTLTPKRWELIRRLRNEGPMTLYALAKMLERNYKNVRLDVKALEEWRIIERDEADRVLVPWDEIDVRVPLAA
jgi:predicted transcriptional regulator